jgi:hypothetical protein
MRKTQKAQDRKDKQSFSKMFPKPPPGHVPVPAPTPVSAASSTSAGVAGVGGPAFDPKDVDWDPNDITKALALLVNWFRGLFRFLFGYGYQLLYFLYYFMGMGKAGAGEGKKGQ